MEGVRSLAKDISYGLREISIAARTVNVALGSIKPEHIPEGQCLNLSMSLELPGRVAKHLAHVDGIIRRADMVLDRREQFLELNEGLTSKFTKEILDLFVDDEVDVEGLQDLDVTSYSLRSEHLVITRGVPSNMGGGGPRVEGAILEGGCESTSSSISGTTEDSLSASPSRRKKKSPSKKRRPLRAVRLNSGRLAEGMIPVDEADIPPDSQDLTRTQAAQESDDNCSRDG